VPLALARCQGAGSRPARAWALALGGLLAAGLLCRGSLGAAALLVGAIACAAVVQRRVRLAHLGWILLFGAVVAAGGYVKRDALRPRAKQALSTLHAAAAQRGYALQTSARAARGAMTLGHGVGSFPDVYGPNRPGDAISRHQAVRRPVSPTCDPAHALVELGLPAALALVWLCLSALRAPGPAEWRSVLVVGLLLSTVLGFAYAPLGLAALLSVVGLLRGAKPPACQPWAVSRRQLATIAVVLTVVGVAGFASPWLIRSAAGGPMDANSPEQLATRGEALLPSDPEEANALLRRALLLFPARRQAVAKNPNAGATESRALAERQARTAELLADGLAVTKDAAASAAYRALAKQLRASSP